MQSNEIEDNTTGILEDESNFIFTPTITFFAEDVSTEP